MKTEVVLTPAESKKLIAVAILNSYEVRNALKQGIVAVHPSSSTVFLYEGILGRTPEGVWVCGVVAPKGLCISRDAAEMIASRGPGIHDPREVSRQTWFFKKGVLQEPAPLGEILEQMGENDVYIKGCNALDPQGNTGVLFGNPAGGGGTIGKVIAALRRKKFLLFLPVGIEKLIPVSISEAGHKAGAKNAGKTMGIPCGLMPVSGRKVDEVDALSMLSGVEATPIAAGGIGGAEGAVVLVLEGNEEQIQKAVTLLQSVKGARLPDLHLPDCPTCTYPTCRLRPEICRGSRPAIARTVSPDD